MKSLGPEAERGRCAPAGVPSKVRVSDETVISNDPAPIGERCFLCEETLTPPWFKTGKFRMHTACRDLVREDFEATYRRRLVNPKTANDNRAAQPSEAEPT